MALKHWKEASSVILSALKSKPSASPFNYDLIALKRSVRNEFMPGGYVFPGGTTNPSDSAVSWFSHFKKFGVDESTLRSLSAKCLPPIFESSCENDLPKFVSLKITAIRETFEETGILLCRGREQSHEETPWACFQTYRDLAFWRSRVQEDANEFFNLCQHFNCYPDVWGLKLWSNWLTPRRGQTRRFDTVFFSAALQHAPTSNADETEVEKLAWFTPKALMTSCQKGEVWLPPPQLYEVGRLLRFTEIEKLAEFTAKRENKGCERWMPQKITTKNGFVSLLPGDGKYSQEEFETGGIENSVQKTNEEYRSASPILHRFEFINEYNGKIIVSHYKPSHSHVLPISEIL